jgi:hypothetical protein
VLFVSHGACGACSASEAADRNWVREFGQHAMMPFLVCEDELGEIPHRRVR